MTHRLNWTELSGWNGNETAQVPPDDKLASVFYRHDSVVWVGYFPDTVNGDTWVSGKTKDEAKTLMESTLILKGVIEP